MAEQTSNSKDKHEIENELAVADTELVNLTKEEREQLASDKSQAKIPAEKLTTLAEENVETRRGETPPYKDKAAIQVIGGIIWIVVLIAIGFWIWWPERADILLNVSAPEQTKGGLDVSVLVLHDGKPIDKGVVQCIILSGVREEHHLSLNLTYEGNGKFTGLIPNDPTTNTLTMPTLLKVNYIGQYMDGKKFKPLRGNVNLQIGAPLPPSKIFMSILTGLGVLIAAILIAVFTGTISRGKARALFVVMYFITFLAMLVPLVAVIAIPESPYLTELMSRAPLGLISGTAPPNISEDQWLLNIGGTVSTLNSQKSDTGTSNVSAAKTTINGGLVVPFFVIMLSLFGAAINMTRRVPEIQRDSVVMDLPGDKDTSLLSLIMRAPAMAFHPQPRYSNKEMAKDAAKIRADAINQFMYLLSAPFLAIAVYYLLQAAAETISTPVLVVMAFATGLMAETVVDAIRDFAHKRFGKDPSKEGSGSVALLENKSV